eukprot:1156600-Pelagomonas_calceolata.AAC.4
MPPAPPGFVQQLQQSPLCLSPASGIPWEPWLLGPSTLPGVHQLFQEQVCPAPPPSMHASHACRPWEAALFTFASSSKLAKESLPTKSMGLHSRARRMAEYKPGPFTRP